MNLAKIKNTEEEVVVLIPSKEYQGVFEDRTRGNSLISYSTLNLVMTKDGKYKEVFDDDLIGIENKNE